MDNRPLRLPLIPNLNLAPSRGELIASLSHDPFDKDVVVSGRDYSRASFPLIGQVEGLRQIQEQEDSVKL